MSKVFILCRCGLSCMATAVLAGCGLSQQQGEAQLGMPQSTTIAPHSEEPLSKNSGKDSSSALLYLSSANTGQVYLYTYPGLQAYGTASSLNAQALGECVDASGDVFVTTTNSAETNGTIYEFAHGGTTPIGTLTDPGVPYGCSVDPGTGNLAVSNAHDRNNSDGEGDIALYAGAKGSPTVYRSPRVDTLFYCGFDSDGNLYADGQDIKTGAKTLFELAIGSSSLTELTLSINAATLGSVQWDGQHITLTAYTPGVPAYIYRLRIKGLSADIVGKTTLRGEDRFNGQSWISDNRIFAIIHPGKKPSSNVDFWVYPSGGHDRGKILQVAPVLAGVTLSPAQNR